MKEFTLVFICILRFMQVHGGGGGWDGGWWWRQRSFLVAQMVKNLPAMQQAWVRPLGWDDLLEKEMATHSSIPAWRIPWTEEPGGLQSRGLQRVRHD